MKRTNRKAVSGHLSAGVALVTLALLAPVVSADNVGELSKRLIQLRAEVEELGAELSLAREEYKQRMSALVAQRGELEGRIKRARVNRERLQKELDRNLEQARQAGANDDLLKPVLLRAIEEASSRILHGLPFKIDERLEALQDIRDQLNKGVMPPSRAATRLWAFYEDEIRLTRENGIYRQPVEVEGEIVLADVARLGMAMLYFVTADGRYGIARKGNEEWEYQVLDDGDDKKRIAHLFDSLHKQIRSGYFELPSPL